MHDFFYFHNENENEIVKAQILQHRDPKTTKPWHQDSKAKTSRHQDSGTKTQRRQETETIKPWHRYPKAFFQKTKKTRHRDSETEKPGNQDTRLKSHGIEFLLNYDLYSPWYRSIMGIWILASWEKRSEDSQTTEETIMFIIFWDILMAEQILLLSQMKRSAIIINKLVTDISNKKAIKNFWPGFWWLLSLS